MRPDRRRDRDRAGDIVLMPRRLVGQGLYPSIDDDWWVCIRGVVVRCVFKPTTGG